MTYVVPHAYTFLGKYTNLYLLPDKEFLDGLSVSLLQPCVMEADTKCQREPQVLVQDPFQQGIQLEWNTDTGGNGMQTQRNGIQTQ